MGAFSTQMCIVMVHKYCVRPPVPPVISREMTVGDTEDLRAVFSRDKDSIGPGPQPDGEI